MGKSCPLQKAQPRGAKLPANIFISAMKGSLMNSLLLARGVDAKQADDEVDAQEWHHIVMLR
jgi:hypothetical protein